MVTLETSEGSPVAKVGSAADARGARPMDMKMLLVLAASAAYLLLACGRDNVSGAEARALVAEGALLLDVRTPGEYVGGHIDGAVNVPIGELSSRLAELPARERPIVVYCASGGRSAQAAKLLGGAGYQVHDLGGIGRWD